MGLFAGLERFIMIKQASERASKQISQTGKSKAFLYINKKSLHKMVDGSTQNQSSCLHFWGEDGMLVFLSSDSSSIVYFFGGGSYFFLSFFLYTSEPTSKRAPRVYIEILYIPGTYLDGPPRSLWQLEWYRERGGPVDGWSSRTTYWYTVPAGEVVAIASSFSCMCEGYRL